jgi:hypothetical protein
MLQTPFCCVTESIVLNSPIINICKYSISVVLIISLARVFKTEEELLLVI